MRSRCLCDRDSRLLRCTRSRRRAPFPIFPVYTLSERSRRRAIHRQRIAVPCPLVRRRGQERRQRRTLRLGFRLLVARLRLVQRGVVLCGRRHGDGRGRQARCIPLLAFAALERTLCLGRRVHGRRTRRCTWCAAECAWRRARRTGRRTGGRVQRREDRLFVCRDMRKKLVGPRDVVVGRRRALRARRTPLISCHRPAWRRARLGNVCRWLSDLVLDMHRIHRLDVAAIGACRNGIRRMVGVLWPRHIHARPQLRERLVEARRQGRLRLRARERGADFRRRRSPGAWQLGAFRFFLDSMCAFCLIRFALFRDAPPPQRARRASRRAGESDRRPSVFAPPLELGCDRVDARQRLFAVLRDACIAIPKEHGEADDEYNKDREEDGDDQDRLALEPYAALFVVPYSKGPLDLAQVGQIKARRVVRRHGRHRHRMDRHGGIQEPRG